MFIILPVWRLKWQINSFCRFIQMNRRPKLNEVFHSDFSLFRINELSHLYRKSFDTNPTEIFPLILG